MQLPKDFLKWFLNWRFKRMGRYYKNLGRSLKWDKKTKRERVRDRGRDAGSERSREKIR